ncbi:MAG: hypothetical protein EBV76_09375, partial [Gammaproteobacteria bacterium]|nr:hypothetical protein [Gammaproteobacteria bacterium]
MQLGHARQIALAARDVELVLDLLELFLDARGALQRSLLAPPDFFQIGVLTFELRQIFFERGESLARRLVFFFLQGDLFDLQL